MSIPSAASVPLAHQALDAMIGDDPSNRTWSYEEYEVEAAIVASRIALAEEEEESALQIDSVVMELRCDYITWVGGAINGDLSSITFDMILKDIERIVKAPSGEYSTRAVEEAKAFTREPTITCHSLCSHLSAPDRKHSPQALGFLISFGTYCDRNMPKGILKFERNFHTLNLTNSYLPWYQQEEGAGGLRVECDSFSHAAVGMQQCRRLRFKSASLKDMLVYIRKLKGIEDPNVKIKYKSKLIAFIDLVTLSAGDHDWNPVKPHYVPSFVEIYRRTRYVPMHCLA